jgi:integrase
MGITFNLELNNRPSKNKTYTILLRITQDKKHIRKKTTVEVKNKLDFNPKAKQGKWIRTSEPHHKKWNETLEKEIELAKDKYRDLNKSGLATKELIKSNLNAAEVSPSFLEFAKQRTKDILNEGGYRNFKKYNGFCNKLKTYLNHENKNDILFSEITSSFLAKFEAFLHSLKNERNPNAKLHPSTITLNLIIFKTLINRAIEVEKIIKPEMNPFLGYKYDKTISTTKEKLNEAEIKKIEELELPEGSLIWHCKNYFLFSFYLAGIRAGDLIQLRWNNITSEGRLEYRMSKTKKDRNIKLHSKTMEILQKYYKEGSKPTDYIFPLLDNDAPYAKAVTEEQKATLPPELIVKLNDSVGSKNALINKYLKKIAAAAEINKKITFHISRHSFAKIAKDKHVDNIHLKNLLGHSNIKITEGYMGNFDTEETDSVMNSIFEEKPDPREILKKQLSEMDPNELENLILEIKRNDN